MKDILESAKKAGAWLIIAFLAVIMGVGLAFNDTAPRQYLDQIAARGQFGVYDGRPVERAIYANAYNYCENEYQVFASQLAGQFGGQDTTDFSRFFNRPRCVRQQVVEIYSLAKIAERLNLDTTEEAIAARVADDAREAFASQQALLPEDRLPLDEMYRRMLQQMPLKARRILRQAELTARYVFGFSSPSSTAAAQAMLRASTTRFDAEIIRFTNPQLQDLIKNRLQLSDEQIRKEYEVEQSKLEAAQRRPFESERSFTENRLRTRLAAEELNRLRKELEGLPKGFELSRAEELLGMKAAQAQSIPLNSLSAVRLSDGQTISLLVPAFLSDLALQGAGATGVYADGEYTIVAQIKDVQAGPAVIAAEDLEATRAQLERTLSNQARAFIQNEENLRARYQGPGAEEEGASGLELQ